VVCGYLSLGVSGFVEAFGPSRCCGWLNLGVSGFIETLGPSLVRLGHFWVHRGVWAFVVLRLARLKRFEVHRNVSAFVGSTWAFPGSSRRSSLHDIPDSSILVFRGSSRRRVRRGVTVTQVWVFLGPSRRWAPRGVLVGMSWALRGSSRRYSLRGIAKDDQKKGREFTLGILCALWTHLARRQSFRVSSLFLAFTIHPLTSDPTIRTNRSLHLSFEGRGRRQVLTDDGSVKVSKWDVTGRLDPLHTSE